MMTTILPRTPTPSLDANPSGPGGAPRPRLAALGRFASLTLGVLGLLGLGSAETAAQPAASAPAAPSATPPSGEYEVTTTVVNTTCGNKRTPGPPLKVAVYVKSLPKGPVGNLALPSLGSEKVTAVPPVQRIDVQFTVGAKVVSTPHIEPACASYKTKYTLETVEATHDRIKVRRTEEYGDGRGCAKLPLDTNCTTTTEYAFALQKAVCEAPCTGQSKPEPGNALAMQCACPKAAGK